MRTKMFSPFLLLVGLVLGLLAMWAGASPLGVTGDLVTGGTAEAWIGCGVDPVYYGVPYALGCGECWSNKCSGTSTTTCGSFAGAGACYGGSITIVTCDEEGSGTRAGGATACSCLDGDGDWYPMHSTCY